LFQSPEGDSLHCHPPVKSDGILPLGGVRVSIPRRGFSSLSLFSGKSVRDRSGRIIGFNPPKGILFIVTLLLLLLLSLPLILGFQSPEGDSLHCHHQRTANHYACMLFMSFNPPKGILFIVTRRRCVW